jgi:uncharacterized membrane protein
MDLIAKIVHAITVTHPLHTLIVHFPIALTATAALYYVLAMWRRSEALELAAFFNLALAAVSTVVAGVTGYRDNVIRFDGAAPYVGAKIVLATTLLVLTTITSIVRWRQRVVVRRPATMILYLAAFGASFVLAATLGFIGGVIIYGF